MGTERKFCEDGSETGGDRYKILGVCKIWVAVQASSSKWCLVHCSARVTHRVATHMENVRI